MFVLPTVFITYPAVLSNAVYFKKAVENSVAACLVPKDAFVANDKGLVVGVINGGVYNAYPV